MKITIRNITKDNMKDFRNDHTITLPMEETALKMFLGSDEWIIVDAPIGEELTNIMELNELLTEKSEEDLVVTGDILTVFKGSEKKDEYKIAVVEKFGYGFSDVADTERDIDSILEDTRTALTQAGLTAPYVNSFASNTLK